MGGREANGSDSAGDRLVVVAHALAGGAAVLAGLLHSASILWKLRNDNLESEQSVLVLLVVGLVLVGVGGWILSGVGRLRRGEGLRGAIWSAGGLVLTIFAIALIFDEYRGVPLVAAPALDLAVLLLRGRRGAGSGA